MSDIKLDMLLDDGSLQADRMSDIKLDMSLDVGSLQAARLSDIKIRHIARGLFFAICSHVRH